MMHAGHDAMIVAIDVPLDRGAPSLSADHQAEDTVCLASELRSQTRSPAGALYVMYSPLPISEEAETQRSYYFSHIWSAAGVLVCMGCCNKMPLTR